MREDKSPEKRTKPLFHLLPSSEADLPVDFALRYKSKSSKLVGMDSMLFPYKICYKMNQMFNVCIAYSVENCIKYFPAEKSANIPFVKSAPVLKIYDGHYQDRCHNCVNLGDITRPCAECEYLNRGQICAPHEASNCQVCHTFPPVAVV